jgi:hypothetical protein
MILTILQGVGCILFAVAAHVEKVPICKVFYSICSMIFFFLYLSNRLRK